MSHPTSRLARVLCALSSLVLVTVSAAPADPPPTLRYQARLVDATGAPVDGTVDAVFRVYDSPVSGVMLWEESHTVADPTLAPVSVDQGFLSVVLGTDEPLDPMLFDAADEFWLGVTLGTDSELAPRLELGSVPFASRAAAADDVPGKDITPASVTVNGQEVIDAGGNWVGPGGGPGGGSVVAFRAEGPGGLLSVPNNTPVVLTLANELFDTANAFDAGTGVFTAPETGIYEFSAHAFFICDISPTRMELQFLVNGLEVAQGAELDLESSGNFNIPVTLTTLHQLQQGDTVTFRAYQSNFPASPQDVANSTLTWASGFKVD